MAIPPFLKRLISYVFELPIAEYSSQYNKQLRVILDRGRYKLVTRGAIYSFSDLYSNFRMSFEKFDWKNHDIKTCLILGLGLGSIPDMLVTRFKKNIHFTAVEIDETVIRIAQEYVLRPKGIPVQIFTADAASFLEWHHGKYDMICSDVFVGDRIPPELQTEEALCSMQEMLKPNGILLYNRLSRFDPDIQANKRFSEEIFMKVFPEGGHLDVQGNWMFVNKLAAFSEK